MIARTLFLVPGARSVAIAGAWNDWSPSPLAADGEDRWRGVLPIGPGSYRFTLLVYRGRLVVPDGVTRLPDDFGGEVGLLVVR